MVSTVVKTAQRDHSLESSWTKNVEFPIEMKVRIAFENFKSYCEKQPTH